MMQKRWCCLLCVLLMLWSSALADSFLPTVDLDSVPLTITLTAEVAEHMPLDEVRLGWLGGLIKHVSMVIRTEPEAERQQLSLMVDDAEALRITQQHADDQYQAQLSMLPEMTCAMPDDSLTPLEVLLGVTPSMSVAGVSLADIDLLDEAEALVREVAAYADSMTVTRKREEITGYGVATQKATLAITATDAEPFGRMVRMLCPENSALRDRLNGLSFQGKQSLTLQYDDQGVLHKLTFSGVCGPTAAEMRSITITWKMNHGEGTAKDNLSFKSSTAASDNTDSMTLTLTRSLTTKGSTQTMEIGYTCTDKVKKQETVYKGDVKLTRTDLDGMSAKLGGTATLSVDEPGDGNKLQWILTPDLLFAPLDGIVNGTLDVQQKQGGDPQEHAVIHISMEQGGGIAWNDALPVKLLEDCTADELMTLSERALNGAASQLVRKLVQLPEEDTHYLSADIDPDVWQQIVDAAASGN